MCGPEFSDLETSIRRRYTDEDVVVLGMSARGGRTAETEELEVFVSAFQVSFPILRFTGETYFRYKQTGNASPFPLDYIIDQTGEIAYWSTEYDPEKMTRIIDDLLGIEPVEDDPPDTETPVPARMFLAAYPNPFNPRTEIAFEVARHGEVYLDIHDARGRLVHRLIDGAVYPAGPGAVDWDGTDDAGRAVPAGLYLARLRSGPETVTNKLTLIR